MRKIRAKGKLTVKPIRGRRAEIRCSCGKVVVSAKGKLTVTA